MIYAIKARGLSPLFWDLQRELFDDLCDRFGTFDKSKGLKPLVLGFATRTLW
jgi:hypothetical protein